VVQKSRGKAGTKKESVEKGLASVVRGESLKKEEKGEESGWGNRIKNGGGEGKQMLYMGENW